MKTADSNTRTISASEAEMLQATLDNLITGIATIRPDGRVGTSNRRFFDMLRRSGLLASEFAGRDDAELAERDLFEIAPDLKDRPDTARGPGGRVFEVRYDERNTETTGMLIVVRDVTEQHMTVDALQKALKQAELIENAHSTFVSQVAHHFRTPLNVILGYVDIMVESGGENLHREEAQSYLGFIRESASALLLNMNDMMAIISLKRNELEPEIEAREFSDTMEEAIAASQDVLRAEGVRIEQSGDSPQLRRQRVEFDMRLFRRGLASLFNTAAVLAGDGATMQLDQAISDTGRWLNVRLTFTPGRSGSEAVLDSVHTGAPLKEISLTGHASGYGLVLAAQLLRAAGCIVDATIVEAGPSDVAITVSIPISTES